MKIYDDEDGRKTLKKEGNVQDVPEGRMLRQVKAVLYLT
jgi:hypothetical protein